ncbi:MAG: hypothetical protein MJ252_02230 [archaeon]|nr:hypothetical protein [archaeon]
MELSKFKILLIVCAALGIIFIVLTSTLPFAIRSSCLDSAREKNTLIEGNAELWGKFPGKLKTTLKHTFSFYDYSKLTQDPKAKLSLDKKVSYIEAVEYQNFTQADDQITFKVKRTFTKEQNDDEKVTLPSIGFYEYLHTISNPSTYQKGMSALKYLTEFSDANNEKFEKQIFLKLNEETFLSEETVKTKFLQGLSEEKKNLIYSDAKYGFNKLNLIYKWAKLVGNPEAISEAPWLTTVFHLTEEEIDSIVGTPSYFYVFYGEFAKKIETDFSCQFKECHLLYRQLSDGTVLSKYNIQNIKELLTVFYPEQISFDSPEMNLYYEAEYKTNKAPFDDIKLTGDQLYLMIDENANYPLFNPKNMILLLGDNVNKIISKDLADKYSIKSVDQLDFISSYIVNYLPKIYIYMNFDNEDKKYQITGKAKTYISLIQNYVSNTYGQLYEKRDRIYSIIQKKMIDNLWKDEDKESLCPEMLQRIIGDGKRVLKICNDDYFNFASEDGLKRWSRVYVCYREEGETSDCDYEFLYEFMQKAVLSDKEMKGIFSDDSLGFYFDLVNEEMSKAYGCKYTRCTGEELALAQYTTSKVTLHPPERITETAYTLKDWSPTDFPEPLEINYYQHEAQISDEDCSEKIKIALSSLQTQAQNIFNPQFKEGQGYINKNKLEIITTLYQAQIPTSKYSEEFGIKDMTNFFKFIQGIIQNKVIQGKVMNEYKLLSVIEGNNDEDKYYVDLLANGQFYDNYKPGITKTTGFNIKPNTFNEEESLEEYTIYTKNGDTEDKVLRRILKMNNKDFINIKMNDYSPKEKTFISVDAPLYSFAPLNKEKEWLSDGFEYPMVDDIKKIYYFDELSTRKYQFDYDSDDTYSDIDCRKYNLNKNDLIQNLIEENAPADKKEYPSAYQVFNKPFIVTTPDKPFAYDIQTDSKDNFFCVDEYTYMTIKNKINLIYGIDSTGFNLFHSEVKEGILPLIAYSREYTVDHSSYEDAFPSIKSYKTAKIVIIVLGIIFALACIGLAVLFFFLDKKEPTQTGPEGAEVFINGVDTSLNKPTEQGGENLLPNEYANPESA